MPDSKDVDVTIRAAEAADVEALADLMTQLGYETRASEMQIANGSDLREQKLRDVLSPSAKAKCAE